MFSYRQIQKSFLSFKVHTFGPMIRSCVKDTTTNRSTSASFVMTIGGQEESGTEKFITLARRIDPVITRRNRAPHTSVLNRRARFTNPRCAEGGSESCFRRGTAPSVRNNMPPTQNVAATGWIQITIMLKKFTIGIVTRWARITT